MLTFQDLIANSGSERSKMEFILFAIRNHESTDAYKIAKTAEQYYKGLNTTIMEAQKYVYNMMGKAVPDIYSANNKIACKYYPYFVNQLSQFLLGNGVSFSDKATKEKLGDNFDRQVNAAAVKAMNGGVAFGFWNFDHMEVFSIASDGNSPAFVPLYDEENGSLRAGIRYWCIDSTKPLRATLYEEDGYTEYIKYKDKEMAVLEEKRAYKQITERSEASGVKIYDGGNYSGFPIVPLYNINRQSELCGKQSTIDAYDLMASTLVNNVDDGNLIYWVLKNCGGMDSLDDAKFIEQMKITHVVHADGDDGADVDAHTVEAPFEANEVALERLRKQLVDDFMGLDVSQIASGATTATQIRAAYEPLNAKADLFEWNVTDFILGIMKLAGIDDVPTYTRSKIVNQQEEIETLLSTGSFLPQDYIVEKIVTVLGDIDRIDDIKAMIARDDVSRFTGQSETEEEEG